MADDLIPPTDSREINTDEFSRSLGELPSLSFNRKRVQTEEDLPEGSLIKSLFRRDTTIGSLLNPVDRGSFSSSDDPNGFLRFVPERHTARFDAYSLVTDQPEADNITRALDRENEDTQRIAATPVKSFFMGFGVQFVDPSNYLPGGVIFNNYKRLSKVAKGALQAGTSGLVSTAVQESIIQSNQLTRELEESGMNMLAAGLLSMGLGGAAAKLGGNKADMTFQNKQFAKKELLSVLTDEPNPNIKTADGMVDPNEVIFSDTVKKGLIQSPRNRLAKSQYAASREVSSELYEPTFLTQKNAQGIASESLEMEIKLDMAEKTKVLEQFQTSFFQQAGIEGGVFKFQRAQRAAAKNPAGQILNWETFVQEGFDYLMLDAEHPNAGVREAIKLAREKVIDPYAKALVENNDLPDGVTPKNAERYAPQFWSRETIIKDEAGFIGETMAGFRDVNNANKKIRKDSTFKKLQEELNSLKKEVAAARKAGNKAELKTLNKSLKEKLKILNEHTAKIAKTIMQDPYEVQALFHTKGSRKGNLRAVSTEAEMLVSADQSVDNILGRSTSKVNSFLISELDGKPRSTKDRSFLLSQKRMKKWMNRDLDSVVSSMIHSLSAYTKSQEFAKRLGFNSMKEWQDARLDALTKEFKEVKRQTSGDAASKLEKQYLKEKQDIKDSFKMQLGIFGDGPNIHDGSYAKYTKTLLNYNYTRLLGFMMLSSIPDVGLTVFRGGMYASIHHGLVHTVKNMMGIAKNMSLDDLKSINVACNTVSGSRLKAMAGFESSGQQATFFGKQLNRMVQGFGNITGMNYWNDFVQQWAGTMSINRNLKTIEQFVTGKNVKRADFERIFRLGISKEDMPHIYKMWKEVGAPEVDGTYFANFVEWKAKSPEQVKAFKNFKKALLTEINEIIVVPGLGDKPTFSHSNIGKLTLQFKSFQFAATNKILLSGIQRKYDWDIYTGMATMLSMGVVSYVVTQMIRGNDDIDLSFETLSKEAFDRSGILGIISEVYNLANKAGLGFGAPTSRFQSRGIWGTVFGPSVGLVEDWLGTINKIRKSNNENPLTTKDLEQMFRLAPYQNLFYTYALSRKVLNNTGPKLGFAQKEDNKFKDIFK